MKCVSTEGETECPEYVLTLLTIKHEETGKLVDFFDPAALADSVIGLLEDNVERERLGIAAREFAISNYDLKGVCLPQQIEWLLQ